MLEPIELLEERLRQTPEGGEHACERVDLLNELGYRLRETEHWERMLDLSAEARRLADAIDYPAGVAGSILVRAFYHYIFSDLKTAVAECLEALPLVTGNSLMEGRVRGVLSMLHWSLGNYEEMMRQGERAMELFRESDSPIDEAFGWSVRGGFQLNAGEPRKALECQERSLKMFEEIPFPLGIGRALAGMGLAYQELGELEKALECHRRALDCAESTQARLLISRALNDLGVAYARLGKETEALDYLNRSLELRREGGFRGPQTTSLLHLARLNAAGGRLDDALELAKSALAISEEIGAKPRIAEAHQLLSSIHERAGRLAEALEHFKSYQRSRDLVTSEQSRLTSQAFELMTQLERTQKDAEIHRLRNVELKKRNEELAALIVQFRGTQAELLQSEKMALLGSMVAALSHEINSPLGVLRSASDTVMRCAKKLAGGGTNGADLLALVGSQAETMSQASQRISVTVNRLKSFAGLDQAEYRPADLAAALDETLALLENEFGERIRVTRAYQPLPTVFCYASQMNQVFLNLLRNAAQAIDGPGTVTVSTVADPEAIRVAVADSGRGIHPGQMPRLFQPGFSSQGRRVHASLSLFTCHDIVRRHGGDILVKSEPGRGSEFTVVLPRALEQVGAGMVH